MRGSLPNRFLTLGTRDRLDAAALEGACRLHHGQHLAVEIDAQSFASPRTEAVVEAAAVLGVEVVARLRQGSTLDRQTIALLRARSCDTVLVTLDGHDAATHDTYHGRQGGFAQTMCSLEQASHLGFDLYVVSRMHHAVLDHLGHLAMLPRWLGARAWYVAFGGAPGILGSCRALTSTQRRAACVSLHRIAEDHQQPIAVRCPECGEAAWIASDACVDPAELAALPCPRRRTAATPVHETAECFAEAVH